MNPVVREPELEILTDATVQATVAAHPFQAKRRIVHVAAGSTAAEIVADLFGTRPCAVTVDGRPVARADFDRTVPRETVVIVGIPGKSVGKALGSVVKAISAIIVTVLAAVVAPVLGPALAGILGVSAGVGTAIAGGALTVAGALATRALFPTSTPQLGQISGAQESANGAAQVSPTYSIGGARNQSNAYGPVPVILGRHRVSPLYAAQPFTENIGEEQYLRVLFCWGHGPLAIDDIRIGETPLSAFQGVEVETFYGLPGDGDPTLFPDSVFQEDLSVEVGATPATRTTAPDSDEIIVDLAANGGIYRYTSDGGTYVAHSVDILIEYSPAGAGSWETLQSTTISGSAPQPLRRSYRVAVDRGQYDVRVSLTSSAYSGSDTVSEAIAWSALRSVRNESPVDNSTVKFAMTALRIRATAQLSGVIETLNGICTSRVTSWNGSSWVADQQSRNPADLFRHVLQGAGNLRPVADSRIDLDQLADWADYCTAQDFTFDQVRDFRASVWSTLRDIAAAGRAAPVFVDGKWSVVWDDSDAAVVQHFTPANSAGFSGNRVFADPPHAFRIRFANEEMNWLQDERLVYDDGYSAANATRIEGMDLAGITSPDLAWRHGRYHIAQSRLRREVYTINVDFEHLACTRGDRVRLSHDVMKVGLGFGRVKAVDGDSVTLAGDVTMESGKSYTMRFRLADGTSSLRVVDTVAGTYSTVTLAADAAATPPAPGDLYQFGETERESAVMRVLAIRPGSDFTAQIELVDDAPAIHDADSGTIPAFDPQITEPPDLFSQPPTHLRAVEFLSLGADGLTANASLSWAPPTVGAPLSYLYSWRAESSSEWSIPVSVAVPNSGATVTGLAAGTWRFRVKAVYASEVSGWSSEAVLEITGPNVVPPNVSGFRSSVSGPTILLSWDAMGGPLVKGYNIRYSPLVSGATWANAAPLAIGLPGTSHAAAYARGTYLIKAVSHNGYESAAATSIVARAQPLAQINVVETETDDPGFDGIRTDVVYSDQLAGLILETSAEFFEPALFFGETFFQVDQPRQTLGYYQFENVIDLGDVFTCRVAANVTVGGAQVNSRMFDGGVLFDRTRFFPATPQEWALTAEISVTDDDPAGTPTWTDWEPLTAGDYTARAFRCRLRFQSFAAQVTPLVTEASFTVDMPDRIVAAEDVQSGFGVAVSFSPAFLVLKAFNVTGQDLATGDYLEVTSKSATGATVTFRNAAGTAVDRTFDWQAIGYGSLVA